MQYLFQKDGRQTMLTPLKLYGEINDLLKDQGDNKEVNNRKIFIDLSNIEWANLTALVELILYIENWIVSGKSVTVALPNSNLLSKEENAINEKKLSKEIFQNKSKRRKNVREWFSKLGVVEVLSFHHLELVIKKRIRLIENYDHRLFLESQKNSTEYLLEEIRINEDDIRINRIDDNRWFPKWLPFLRWINVKEIVSENGIISSELINELMTCIAKSDLKTDFAIDISKRIIVELIKNTRDHSSKNYFLFGIAKNPFFNYERVFFDAEKKSIKTSHKSIKDYQHPYFLGKQYLFDEFTFYQSIFNEECMIEIAFGETGIGIPESLKSNPTNEYLNVTDNELLKISFDKWTSRIKYDGADDYIKRGTRGLYHIRRLTTKYDGFVAIRNKDNYVGFNDLVVKDVNNKVLPELDYVESLNTSNKTFNYNFKPEAIKGNNNIPHFSGTLFTIKLLPERVNKLSYKFFPRNRLTSEFTYDDINNCRIEADIDNYVNSLHQIGEKSKQNNYKLFLISIKTKDISNDNEFNKYKEKVRLFLTKLSDMRHPSIHIVYGLPTRLSENWFFEDIESFINSFIEIIKQQGSDEYSEHTYFDPVLIINPKGEIFWIGTNNEKKNKLLKELTKSDNGIYKKAIEKEADLINFVNDDKELFSLSDDKIFLNINKNAPIDYLGNIIKLTIDTIENEFNRENKASLTPNLVFTKGWFPINKISEHLNETILALYSLWIENRMTILKKHFPKHFEKDSINYNDPSGYELDLKLDEAQKLLLQNNIKILVESETDKELGERFLKLLDISESHNYLKVLSDEFDYKKPRRLPLFESSDYVIILCSLVSSGETLKRMIKSVLRSNATPLVALSLVDISPSQSTENTVPVWGNNVFYFSKIKDNRLRISDMNIIKSVEYRGVAWNIEPILDKSYQQFKVKEPLREMIIQSESLHFNHIGKPNARHFTFYFNASRFLTLENYKHGFLKSLWKFYFPDENEITFDIESFQNFIWQIFMRKKMLEHIKDDNCLHNSIIWYPDSDYSKGYQKQGEDIAKIIQMGLLKEYGSSIDIRAIPREDSEILNSKRYSTIIIADWGSLTLETIEKMIYKAHLSLVKEIENINNIDNVENIKKINQIIREGKGVKNNIIISIFINQLPKSKHEYIKKISDLKTTIKIKYYENEKKELYDGKATKEFLEGKFSKLESEIDIFSKVNIIFFNDFPLTCFESDYECDVCAIIRDLNDYSFPGEALNKYLVSRKNALNIRTRETTIDNPFDFYSTKDKIIPLSANSIMKMFEFKNILMLALNSTYYRHLVQKKLLNVIEHIINDIYDKNKLTKYIEIWKKIKEESDEILAKQTNVLTIDEEKPELDISDPESEINSIIYFLSIETSWVQKPPLSIDEVRKILKLITKAIIFNENLLISDIHGIRDINIIRSKYAAITVLRMVDKSDFIEHLFDLVQATQNYSFYSNSILENILFHTNTFISKEYHASHKDINPLIDEIERLSKTDIAQFTEFPFNESLYFLRKKALSLNIKGDVRRLTKSRIAEACLLGLDQGFSKYRNGNHIKFVECYYELKIDTSFPKPSKAFDDFKNDCKDNWKYLTEFIGTIISNHLIHLKVILSTDWARLKGSDHLNFYINDVNFGRNDRLSVLINDMINSNFELLNDVTFIKEYNTEYNNIGNSFIWHPNNTDDKRSILYTILSEAKSNIFELSGSLLKKFGHLIDIEGENNLRRTIFYPKDELIQLFTEIFKNTEFRTIPGQKPKIKIIIDKETVDFIRYIITFKNTDKTKKKPNGGKGLLLHKDLLPFFDGELKYSPLIEGDFFMEIKFLKYD